MAEATNPSLRLAYNYRGVTLDPRARREARRCLAAARDALHLALLTLDDPITSNGRSAWERISRARDFLAEAVADLSKARVHIPGIRTLALPALMATMPSAPEEALRLHQISTKLLWSNHEHLPHKPQAKPLTDEDEAQLARVLRSLDGHRRRGSLARHKWLASACVAAGLTTVVGPAAGLAALAFGVLELNEIRRRAG